MTIETWTKEFYPVLAQDVPADKAAQYSLTKWIGLRPENLAKHGLTRTNMTIRGQDGHFWIDDTTCALCHHYLKDTCEACPLYLSLGADCDASDSHWRRFAFGDGNPEPMIEALQELV